MKKKPLLDMVCYFCAKVPVTATDAVVAPDEAIKYLKQHPELWKLESIHTVRKPVKKCRESSTVLR